MKNLKLFAILLAVGFMSSLTFANVYGPYTPDANTVYLFHFNEPAGSYIATNAPGSLAAGTNAVAFSTAGNTFPGLGVSAPTNYNILGGPGASGFAFGNFGNAAYVTNVIGGTNGLGVDANLNGGFSLDNLGTAVNDAQANHGSIVGANNSFTLEALIKVAATNSNQEIICTDNGAATAARGFQFRLNGPLIEFNDIGSTPGGFTTPIPSSGPHAFVTNAWFHVALVHTESPSISTVIYWTRLDDAYGVANAIFTNTVETMDAADPMILVIGNEGRSSGASLGSSEGLQGVIDEVRISNANRSASQMMFFTPVITFTTQPTPNQYILTNSSTSLTALATGPGTIGYQWYFFDATSTNLISGATSTTLNITSGPAAGVSNYFCVATNGGISTPATSTVATVTVVIPQDLQWKGAGADWDYLTANWTTNAGATAAFYTPLANATFDSVGAGVGTVNLTTNFSPPNVTVNTSGGDYSLGGSGTGVITGTGSLTKNANGKLTLTTSNTFSGGTTINGGTVELDAVGQIGTGSILNNGAIVANGSGTVGFPATISGSGSLSVNGGAASLDVSNSYSGSTTISGVVYARNGSSFGATGTGTTVNIGGQIYFTTGVDFGPETFTISGAGGDGNGAFRKGGASASTLFGTVAMNADTTVGIDGGATLTLSNTLSGTANLTKNGSGTLNLSAANNYDGTTTVSGGTLGIVDGASLGAVPVSFTANQISMASSTLGALTNVSLIDGRRGITITTAGGFSVATGSTLTVSNAITAATATITKSSPGTLVLKGDNSTTLSGITFNTDTSNASANDGNTLLTSPNALAGLTILNMRNNNTGSSTLQLDGSSGDITIAPVTFNLSGRNNPVPAVENIAGNNTLNPSFSFVYVSGGGTYQFASDAGTLTIGSTLGLPTTAPSGFRTTMFSGSGNIVVSSVIQDFAVLSTFTNYVLKTGSGTLTLSAANTYQNGNTVISNGLLRVDGSIAAGGPVICAGGSLGGIGTINTAVSILPGGTLAPGDSVGTLTINSSLNIAGNLGIEVDKSLSPSQSNDVAVVSGVLTNSGTGTVTVSNLGPALSVGDTFVLFSQAVSNGAAMSVTGGGVLWNNNLAVDGSIAVASIINTNPTNITSVVNGSNLELSWPADRTGWHLQVQTNSLSVGLLTNTTSWVTIPNTQLDNHYTNAINPSNGSVFYRMVYP
jgi:autotransporter-associated beta strand protein